MEEAGMIASGTTLSNWLKLLSFKTILSLLVDNANL